MTGDQRGWRIALVPDALLNPPTGTSIGIPNILELLDTYGYGVLQLPPPGDYSLLLSVTADQIAEYSHHGYAVVAIGIRGESGDGLHWRRLSALLRRRKAPLPLRHVVQPDADSASETQRLAALLATYDLPEDERRRWRV